MKKLLIALCILMLNLSSYSQDLMSVDNFQRGLTYFGGLTKNINSLNELPPDIYRKLNLNLKSCFGDSLNSIRFLHGQEIDIKKYYRDNPESFGGVVPKYDLEFMFSDTSLGIKSFEVNVRMDEYGQVLKFAWPREWKATKDLLYSKEHIIKRVMIHAKKNGITSNPAATEFRFDPKNDQLIWVFLFPKGETIGAGILKFDAIEIEWLGGKICGEYEVMKRTVQ